MVLVLWGQACRAQQSAASAEPNDFKPASTNVIGLQYPQVGSAGQVKVFYVSMGSKEGAGTGRSIHETLEKAGVKHVYYEAPGTGHGFQTWRKSLHGFAQLLFKD
jgi:enterochelin esterase family protein